MRAQAREHLTHARARCASTGQARARDARAKSGARARCASKAREHCARAHFGHARAANKLSKSGFGELICDLESLFARAESLFARARVGRARARTRARILALLAHLARARLYLPRASRARACRCSRTSRAHVLNARALALRTPQLVRHHIWINMFWIKPSNEIFLCGM